MSIPGTVYLVGAGPGAADLLTVRAVRLLQKAEIVLHDALVDPEVLGLAAQARQIAVGKRCGQRSSAQSFINKQLVDAAQRYATIVRLKGGDPMLFGRAQEEIAALQAANVPYQVVPGISAAFGAASQLGCSLTQRGISRSVCFLTPAVGRGESGHDWARPASAADTVVLYMASRQAQSIRDGLLAAGVQARRPVALVENATLPNQRTILGTLDQLPELAEGLSNGPALILIGDVLQALQTISPSTLAQNGRAAQADSRLQETAECKPATLITYPRAA